MNNRMVILYLITFLLCDLIPSAHLRIIKKRKKAIRTEIGDEDNIIQEKNEKTDLNNNSEEEGPTNDQQEIAHDKNDSETENVSESKKESVLKNEDTAEVTDDNQKDLQKSDEISDTQNKAEEEYINEEKNKSVYEKENIANVRPYTVGDTFTPQEMLPITQKLLSKVNKPGDGKGFVSSCKSPEQLADKLFEAFFITFKRIVTLTDLDITGLDALQALALSGEAVDNATEEVSKSEETIVLRGQIVKVNNYPKNTKYKLIMKSITPNENDSQKGKRRAVELAKKLRKQRRLVINKRRNRQDDPNKKQPSCHWRYECTSPNDLDTCQIHTQCVENKTVTERESATVPQNNDEPSINTLEFRKMLGISIIDEEVEKILENRVIRINPQTLNGGNRIERVESLSEYFNNIINIQSQGVTASLSSTVGDNNTAEVNNDNGTGEAAIVESENDNENQQEIAEIRKSLKFPKTSTPYYTVNK